MIDNFFFSDMPEILNYIVCTGKSTIPLLKSGTEPAWDHRTRLAFKIFLMIILKNYILFVIYEKCPSSIVKFKSDSSNFKIFYIIPNLNV